MGFFKFRGSLVVGGGSAQIGADTNLYRSAANILKTDDALTVAGALIVSGASTLSGTVDASGGTALLLPYATASPNVSGNGHLSMLQKGNRTYLLYYGGGTPCYIALPQTTDGTITCTIGGTP